MRIFVTDLSDRKLTYSVVNAASGQIWSPGVKAWKDVAPDALLSPKWSTDPAHKGCGPADFAGLPQPAAAGDYLLLGHDPVTTLPVGAGWPLSPTQGAAPQVVYVGINIGG